MTDEGGWAVVIGPCCICRQTFGFNPHRVPSHEGEPVCSECMTLVNERRAANGLPPHPIQDGAYEPLPEAEL